VIDALLLCAGIGSRLHPLTEETPKPLLSLLHNETIVSRIVKQLSGKVGNIFINLNYLAEQFLDENKVGSFQDITFLFERERLGGHNTLLVVSKISKHGLLVIHGDIVLGNRDFSFLLKTINASPDQSVLVVHERLESLARSKVEVENDGLVKSFIEIKASRSSSETCLSSSGVYYFSRSDLESIKIEFIFPLGADLTTIVIPKLVEMRRLGTFVWTSERISVDSLANLNRAREILRSGGFE
jgi:NDP-sugar pyrophosphorylase family protein